MEASAGRSAVLPVCGRNRRKASRWGGRSQPRPGLHGARGGGPNMQSRTGSEPSMSERDAVVNPAGIPGQPQGAGGGTTESLWHAPQTDAVGDEIAEDRPPMKMEEVLRRKNMQAAYRRVVQNRGAPGIDGMTVDALGPALHACWERIRKGLLGDRYHPEPERKVELPKPGGKGMRTLGFPTVTAGSAAPGDSGGAGGTGGHGDHASAFGGRASLPRCVSGCPMMTRYAPISTRLF